MQSDKFAGSVQLSPWSRSYVSTNRKKLKNFHNSVASLTLKEMVFASMHVRSLPKQVTQDRVVPGPHR